MNRFIGRCILSVGLIVIGACKQDRDFNARQVGQQQPEKVDTDDSKKLADGTEQSSDRTVDQPAMVAGAFLSCARFRGVDERGLRLVACGLQSSSGRIATSSTDWEVVDGSGVAQAITVTDYPAPEFDVLIGYPASIDRAIIKVQPAGHEVATQVPVESIEQEISVDVQQAIIVSDDSQAAQEGLKTLAEKTAEYLAQQEAQQAKNDDTDTTSSQSLSATHRELCAQYDDTDGTGQAYANGICSTYPDASKNDCVAACVQAMNES